MPETQPGGAGVSVQNIVNAARQRKLRAPASVAETGLGWDLLGELLARHLARGRGLTLDELSLRLGLRQSVVRSLIEHLARQGLIEASDSGAAGPFIELCDTGHAFAAQSALRNSYCGPAPIGLDEYRQLVADQSVRRHGVRHRDMRRAFDGVVIDEKLLGAVGRGLNSSRAMLLYGPSGAGKTYLAQRVIRAFAEPTLIPHAVAVRDAIIPVHDAALHEPWPRAAADGEAVAGDGRFALCRPPGIICGAQLNMDMLELRFDATARTHEAPLQLKANNGVLIIDDLGRQRMPLAELLNRWIVPLETQQDWLTLDSGASFAAPFDVVLILVTNLEAGALDSEMFRRRVAHKVRLGPIEPAGYEAIWRQVCERDRVGFDPRLTRHSIEELHARHGVPLLPSHPEDLLSLMQDQLRYSGGSGGLTVEMLETAWETYFAGSLADTFASGQMNQPVDNARAERRTTC